MNMIGRWLLAASLLVALPTAAATTVFVANLSGPAENPPNASPGIGFAQVTFNDLANTMRVQISFSGLLGTTTASHIHCCTAPPGTAIVATTTPNFPGFPLGVLSGTYDQTLDMGLATSYNPAFITAHGNSVATAEADLIAGMFAGQSYLNIHSSVVPGGEIRGFLAPVPEPQTYLMLAAGLGLLGFTVRRKAKS
jgi:hypothetical protein